MRRLAFAAALAAGLVACDLEPGDECLPGVVTECTCEDGGVGLAECQALTRRFGACFCGPLGADGGRPPAPDAAARPDATAADATPVDSGAGDLDAAPADAGFPADTGTSTAADAGFAPDAAIADAGTSTIADAGTSTVADGG